MQSILPAKLSSKIIGWYRAQARDLPWRATRDPYAIWISEVMLQQTQVKTVIPYWERWMERFPTVERLARAKEQSVLKAWEGLGYYSRARNLLRAARFICDGHEGKFPSDFEAVLALPGIGRYTAGAICSIAFGQARPILDGNVARVLSRIFLIEQEIKSSAAPKKLWRLATELVERAAGEDACSELNQGLMELGATICLPRQPECPQCPVRRECGAFKSSRVEEFPRPGKRPQMKQRFFVAFILRKGDSVLVRKRDAKEVNGGLWEFPNMEPSGAFDAGLTSESGRGLPQSKTLPRGRGSGPQCAQIRRGNLPSTGQGTNLGLGDVSFIRGIQLTCLATIRHTIMNNRITVEALMGTVNGTGPAGDALAKRFRAEWRSLRELKTLPFTAAHARLCCLIQAGAQPKIRV